MERWEGMEGLVSLVTLGGSENALASARSECLPAVQQAMSHRLDLFSLA